MCERTNAKLNNSFFFIHFSLESLFFRSRYVALFRYACYTIQM